MPTELEKLGYSISPISKTVTPFETWLGSSIKEWTITIQLLTTGEQMEMARSISNDSPAVLMFSSKIHLLAFSIKAINNQPVITDEQLKQYRNDNKTDENFTIHDYVVLFLKKLPTQAIDALTIAYDNLQNEYAAKLLGVPLPDALKIKTSIDAGLINESPNKKGN